MNIQNRCASLDEAIATGNVEEINFILDAAKGLLKESLIIKAKEYLKMVALCEKIHNDYEKYKGKCKTCTNCTPPSEAKENADCFLKELKGRGLYLNYDCDKFLPGSIKRGIDIAREGHWEQYLQKEKAMNKCLEIARR